MKGLVFVCIIPEDCPLSAADALGCFSICVASFNGHSESSNMRVKLQVNALLRDMQRELDKGGFTAEFDGNTDIMIRNPRNYDEQVLMTIRGYKLLGDENPPW